MREITKIQSKIKELPKRKKVAAYARVSSSKDAMLHSLSAQISYYNDYISSHNDWEFVGVYADSGITGTKENRPEFMRMCSDCRAGKIDMVITKSITRFARNTVTLLSTVRELKELGIDVYFEKERIHTLSSDGELMITLLASYAQEESLSVSENCKWKIRHNFENGIANTFSLYGYEKVNGEIRIKEDEAEIVREIFRLYLSGVGTTKIAKELRNRSVPSPFGAEWSFATIKETLKNEKYTGNMLLQKYYSKDHLCKKTIKNRGVLPKYYVENTHPAIITKADFDEVQKIFESRNKNGGSTRLGDYEFKGMIFCGCCGWSYTRKKNYKKYVWKCSKANSNGKEYCTNKQIPDDILRQLANEIDGKMEKIIILPDNTVKFVLFDKSEILKSWIQPSRAESWTDEMKEEAAKISKERRWGNAKSNKNKCND